MVIFFIFQPNVKQAILGTSPVTFIEFLTIEDAENYIDGN